MTVREGSDTVPPPPAGPTAPGASLLRGAGVALLLQGGGLGVTYLLHLLLARSMGPGEYGAYVYVVTWAATLAIPVGLGLPTAAVRLVAERLASGAWAELRGFLRRSWQLTALVGTAVAAAVALTIVALAPRLDAGLRAPALWGVWLIPLLALLSLQAGASRGAGGVVVALAPDRVARPLLLLTGALVAANAGGLSAVTMVRITLGVLAVLVAAQLAGFVRTVPRQAVRGEAAYATAGWLRIALPMMFTSAFLVLQNQSDILLIGLFLDRTEVGLYNAASKTAALVSLSLVAVTTIAAPTFAAAHATGGRGDLQRAAARAAHLGFWPALAAAVGLLAFGGPLLRLFGASFVAARLPLTVLVGGQLVNAAAGPVGYLLAMTGYQDDNARVFAVSALLNLGLNALLIPAFGLVGAATATALTMVLWNVWLHALTVRRLGVWGSVLAVPRARR